MAQDNKKRALRVYAHYSRRERDGVFIPEIKLQGIYLQNAGFEIGDFIEVNFCGGMITIQKGGES